MNEGQVLCICGRNAVPCDGDICDDCIWDSEEEASGDDYIQSFVNEPDLLEVLIINESEEYWR